MMAVVTHSGNCRLSVAHREGGFCLGVSQLCPQHSWYWRHCLELCDAMNKYIPHRGEWGVFDFWEKLEQGCCESAECSL